MNPNAEIRKYCGLTIIEERDGETWHYTCGNEAEGEVAGLVDGQEITVDICRPCMKKWGLLDIGPVSLVD